jgi:flagellar hook-associated protein 2
MSTVNLPGLLSGIDTSTLISQLMQIESNQKILYENRQKVWTERQDDLNSLQTKLTSLQSSIGELSDAGKLRSFSTKTSDSDIITAEAASGAVEGNHTVIVNRLANAEQWVQTDGLEYAEDYVGQGTFIYSYNNKETALTTTATTTFEDLVGLINNDANNPGVTAGLLYYNDKYHLVLSGNDAGADYKISVNTSSTEVWQAESELSVDGDDATLSTHITDLDQFGTSPLRGGEVIEITGTDHNGNAITSVNLSITSNTKLSHIIDEINDAFAGAAVATLKNGKIVLTDTSSGTSSLSINLTYQPNDSSAELTLPVMSVLTEGGSTTASLANFTQDDFTQTQAANDSQIRVDGYPPDGWISRSSNTIDDVINGVTLHLHDTTDEAGIKVTLTRNIDAVKDKINAMVDTYNQVISYISQKTDYNESTKIAGSLMGDYTVTSVRSQLSSLLISKAKGFINDIDTFLLPGQLGLELDSDGKLSFDTSTFDEAVSEDYMDVLALIGADKTGSSNSNTIKFYNASSKYTMADTYNVQVVISGGVISSAKIKLSSETTYRDASFSGNIITGNSSFDSHGDPLYGENGLQLSVDLSRDGTYSASVWIKQGFAGAMEVALDKMLKTSTGSLQIDQEHIKDQIESLQERIDNEEARLTKKKAQLTTRFATLEKTLALLQSQMSALGISSS